MRDASSFDDAAFLGLARRSKRDSYRLALFAVHFEPEEKALALLAVRGGTLVVTDLRVLEFRAHLEIHGAWNVKEFRGYELRRHLDRGAVRAVEHVVGPVPEGGPEIEDVLVLSLQGAAERIEVSRGPEPTLPEEEFALLRTAILGQPK